MRVLVLLNRSDRRRLRQKRSGKGKREKQSVAASMSEILECVIIDDILSRLPVKDLLQFRCVSKRWRGLIDSPMFIKLQLNRSLETGTNLSVIFKNDELYSVDLDMLDGVLKLGRSVPRLDVVEIDNPIKSDHYWTCVAGSCNGLICLYRFTDETIALLNPSTKEYRVLPPVPLRYDGCPRFYGTVYDPIGDDYKVVRIVQFLDDSHSLSTKVMVYGLRSNMWRRICESFIYCLYMHCKKSVLVNGALHWLACRDRLDLFQIVVAFDPVDEEHWEVQLPQVSSYKYGTLGVLGGCLCIFYSIEKDTVEFTVELWVMNDYMVEESWTKLFRVTLPNVQYSQKYSLACAKVLAYSKSSREVILLQMFGNLIWYDMKEKRVVHLGICSFWADINVKSLVKLNHYQ